MEMKLKPNVLEDLAREHRLIAPPPVEKIRTPGQDSIMLEDSSGRIRLVGPAISSGRWSFTTGVITGVLGAETKAGDFDVIDICFAGMPEQSGPVNQDGGSWVAITSGLEFGGGTDSEDVRFTLLADWLTGELGGPESQHEVANISRLILAGNSTRQPVKEETEEQKPKRYGYDSTSWSPKPTEALSNFLADVLNTIDVDLLPGDLDPCGPTLPQQPMHKALLPSAAGHPGFTTRSNPSWFDFGSSTFLGTSGQTLDDVFKYLESNDRLDMACHFLEWSHLAPTAPDTLWCHPFAHSDPFLLRECPHVIFFGNQPCFESCIATGQAGQRVRVILVPRFCQTGEIIVVHSATLEVKVFKFSLP